MGRFFRGQAALLLVQALADPGVCDAKGESAEAYDLDGLLHEAEREEAYVRREKEERLKAVAAAAKKGREEREWREKMFELSMDDEEGAGYGGLAGLLEKAQGLISDSDIRAERKQSKIDKLKKPDKKKKDKKDKKKKDKHKKSKKKKQKKAKEAKKKKGKKRKGKASSSSSSSSSSSKGCAPVGKKTVAASLEAADMFGFSHERNVVSMMKTYCPFGHPG